MTTNPPAFPIAPLRLSLRSGGLSFPGFSGSLWHGGLGEMLERHFRPAFDLLYGGSNETRLYAILPPPQHELQDGSAFALRLTLIGPATRHILACVQAVAQLGERGLGPAGRFRLESAAVIGAQGDQTFCTAADGLIAPPTVANLVDYCSAAADCRRIRLQLQTPLRLKEGNDLLRQPPAYGQVFHRLCSRIDQLAYTAGLPCPLPKTARPALFEAANQVRLPNADLHPDGLARRSARTGQQMRFGGLLGSLEYEGDLTATLPWLMAGRWLHIGGKPAFGFGAYDIEDISSKGSSTGRKA